MGTNDEIKALTGLRGIGAVWVFLFHLLARYDIPMFRQGHLAVPMFFVLSGFILVLVHEGDFQRLPTFASLRVFFASRFARIYPLHLFVLIILFVLTVVLPGFADRYESHRFSLPNFFASLFLVQTWGIGHIAIFKDSSDAWNGPAWSLSAEMAYYISFPWIAHAFLASGRRGFVLQQAVLCAILALTTYGLLPQSSETYTRTLICGWFAFCFGISVCVLAMRSPPCSTWIAEVGGVGFILSKLVFQELNTGFFVLGVGMLIFALTRRDSLLAPIFSSRIIYFFGKISFSIYVIHWPMIQLLNYMESNAKYLLPVSVDFSRVALIPAVFILAGITYAKIELPTRRFFRRLMLNQGGSLATPII